ncbi:hypothetical protein CIB84_017455 [Bambusicola thoracicus]|uniref:Uncharacterized protein n=1 Tax=Bambusicola thoracicus TaxID=9083 RepID=A0A2P4S3Y8_BAMTH|nr:hypothetical protein CIB84_017455 [Bambusicola thoracicus]
MQDVLLPACQQEVELRAEEEPLGERRHRGGFGSSFSVLSPTCHPLLSIKRTKTCNPCVCAVLACC